MSHNPRLIVPTSSNTRSLSQENQKHIIETYTYDNNGNRASATVHNETITASYTLDDNLVVYGDNSYRYDNDGYLQNKTTPQGTSTYSYGTLGELREVTTPTQSISYQHNANNQRVAKEVNGTIVEKYLWANLTTLLAVYNPDDTLKQRFEYADQRMPIAMTQDNQKYYLHYDQVGSLRAISDSNHNIVKEVVYDTFGNILTDSNPSFNIPFGFAGGLYDTDSKLTRFGYRDYDAYTGKWTAKDPIGFDGGDSNLYGYVLGDPVGFVDPSGLVNLNLFEEGTSDYWWAYQTGLFNPGFTIGGHGDPNGIGNYYKHNIDDLIKLMNKNGYDGGPVSLLSCDTGAGDYSFAQYLASRLGVTVYAPTSLFNYHGLGVYSTHDRNGLIPFYPWR